MKTIQKYFLVVLSSATLLLPHLALAQTANNQGTCAELKQQFDNAGGTNVVASVPWYCSVPDVYTKFINVAMFAVGIVAVLAIIYGGYLYMTAQSNEAQRKKGRDVLTWAVIGLVVVIAAAVIVDVVVKGLVEKSFV